MCHIVLIDMFRPVLCLLWAVHFHTVAKDMLLCTIFISQYGKDARIFAVAVLCQNMRAVVF